MKRIYFAESPTRAYMAGKLKTRPDIVLAAGRVNQEYIQVLRSDPLLTEGYTRLLGPEHINNGSAYGNIIQAIALLKGECTIEPLFNS